MNMIICKDPSWLILDHLDWHFVCRVIEKIMKSFVFIEDSRIPFFSTDFGTFEEILFSPSTVAHEFISQLWV